MATLIAVYDADGGVLREFLRGLGRTLGAHACALSHIARSTASPRSPWKHSAPAWPLSFATTWCSFIETRELPRSSRPVLAASPAF